jgi:hypothetical protein
MKSVVALLLLLGLASASLGQAPESTVEISFLPAGGAAPGPGRLQIDILPPNLYDDADDAVPVTLSLQALVYSGEWLIGENSVASAATSEEEAFVRTQFHAFQDFETAEAFRDLLDAQTFEAFTRDIAAGRIDLAADRELYAGYDNIRLLGSVRYGVYTLLYTQFRETASGRLDTSVMTVRRVAGELRTAGSLNASPPELYRMLTLGTLRVRLMDHLERLTGG